MTELPVLQYVDETLIENTKPFMYTEYPHKRQWPSCADDYTYRQTLLQTAATPKLLYVHIPFCPELCWFCTCHMLITSNYQRVRRYLANLRRELDLLSDWFGEYGLVPNIREIHLGGGSPTVLEKPEFDQLLAKLGQLVKLNQLQEFSIEVDPRRVSRDTLYYYANCGITRLSFGVQDFSAAVQAAVNRLQPAELTACLLTPDVRRCFRGGINFDLICGLPNQTTQSIRDTCRQVVALEPDRICLNYLHYIPEAARHQQIMADGKAGRPTALPDRYERKALFIAALEILLAGGYRRTGYDHFAKPADPVTEAAQSGVMQWNALGATPGHYRDVIGVGVSSLSTLGNYYAQNCYGEADYQAALTAGRFPVFRQCSLSPDDALRRAVIQQLRSYFRLDFAAINQHYQIDCQAYFATALAALAPFVLDGLVLITPEGVTITETGCQFANLIASRFDAYLL